MFIYKNLSKIKRLGNSVLAIGNFDGLHLGHQKVLNEAYKKAKKSRIKFGIMTFEPLPVMFFNKNIKNHRINNLTQKIESLKKMKVDFLIIIKFNIKFSKTTYKNFIKNIIFKKTKCKFLFISKNFRFGKNREGILKNLFFMKINIFIKLVFHYLSKRKNVYCLQQ